jgi:hypothetical protein
MNTTDPSLCTVYLLWSCYVLCTTKLTCTHNQVLQFVLWIIIWDPIMLTSEEGVRIVGSTIILMGKCLSKLGYRKSIFKVELYYSKPSLFKQFTLCSSANKILRGKELEQRKVFKPFSIIITTKDYTRGLVTRQPLNRKKIIDWKYAKLNWFCASTNSHTEYFRYHPLWHGMS